MQLNSCASVIVAIICILVKQTECFPSPQHNEHEITKVNGHLKANTRFVYGPEEAPQENEGIPSAIFTKYDNSQLKAGGVLRPTALIDNIKEEDKYGNSGDKFEPFGRALISGYEKFSNFINRVVDKPFELSQSLSRSLTNRLNDVGAKLVGLA